MFRIGTEQLARLRHAKALAMVPWLVEQLRSQRVVAADRWTSEALHTDTTREVKKALGIGLRSGRDLLGFVTLRHTVGAEFERLPEIEAALSTPSEPEGWRVDRMMHDLDLDYWQSARAAMQARERS